jgi:hypothetical protein
LTRSVKAYIQLGHRNEVDISTGGWETVTDARRCGKVVVEIIWEYFWESKVVGMSRQHHRREIL